MTSERRNVRCKNLVVATPDFSPLSEVRYCRATGYDMRCFGDSRTCPSTGDFVPVIKIPRYQIDFGNEGAANGIFRFGIDEVL